MPAHLRKYGRGTDHAGLRAIRLPRRGNPIVRSRVDRNRVGIAAPAQVRRITMNPTDVPFWGPDFAALQSEDPEIAGVVLGELDRLRGGLQLIASENFTSPAVLAALGS